MKDEIKINNYVSALSQQLSSRLVEGVDIKTIVHPVNQEGAVIEIVLEKGTGGGIEYQDATETVNDAASTVSQNLVTGDLSGITFSGTNISMQDNRIVLIKGGDADNEWNTSSAASDLNRIFNLSEGSK